MRHTFRLSFYKKKFKECNVQFFKKKIIFFFSRIESGLSHTHARFPDTGTFSGNSLYTGPPVVRHYVRGVGNRFYYSKDLMDV